MIRSIKTGGGCADGGDIVGERGVSNNVFMHGSAKDSGVEVNEAREAKRLRDENARLNKAGYRPESKGYAAVGDKRGNSLGS